MRSNGMIVEKRTHIGTGVKQIKGRNMQTLLRPVHVAADVKRFRMNLIAKGLLVPADPRELQEAQDYAAVKRLLAS
jgi:hypothetical protein